jgi:hypothetical protein
MRRQNLRRPPLIAIGCLAGRTALTIIVTLPEPQRTAVPGRIGVNNSKIERKQNNNAKM